MVDWMNERGIKKLDFFLIRAYCEENGEVLFHLVTFIVCMHVCWHLPEEFICGVSGLYNQGRNS